MRELPLYVDVAGDAERHELGALKVAEEGLKASEPSLAVLIVNPTANKNLSAGRIGSGEDLFKEGRRFAGEDTSDSSLDGRDLDWS
jgi:hypothetical protein